MDRYLEFCQCLNCRDFVCLFANCGFKLAVIIPDPLNISLPPIKKILTEDTLLVATKK